MEIFDLKDKLSYLKQVMTLEYEEWADLPNDHKEERIQKKIQFYYDYMNEPDYCKLILLDQDTLIGFISLFPKDGEEDLSPWYATMYVVPEYRGMGYSKLLNDALIEEAKNRGIPTLYLKTDLYHFYEKYGARYLKPLNNGENLYRMDLVGDMMKSYSFWDLFPYYTERLMLRPTTEEDLSLLLKMDSQEEVQRFLGGVKNYSEEERREFLAKKVQSYQERKTVPFTICLKDEKPIGFIELKENDNREMELSYLFDFDYWKRGYCTEAVQKILTKAFDAFPIDKVVAHTMTENYNSTRVLEKTGFQFIGKDGIFDEYELRK